VTAPGRVAPGEVTLRRITEDDTALLVKWRNENAKFFPPQPDWTPESHLKWFREVYQRSPSDNLFIAEYRSRPAGTLAMTIRDGRGELERMILGDKTLARGGIMQAAFRQLMDAYGLDSYWLRIYPWNEVTISFHRRNGFEVTGLSDDGEYLVMERREHPW
jgi:RimJ/RimL family protein N-acetyltransferase